MLKKKDAAMKGGTREVILSIVRMSQKALACVLAFVAIGFFGGLIAIAFRPDLADAMTKYADVFVPVFQLEIGVYGLGSAAENITKIKTQIDVITGKTTGSAEDNG